MPRNSAVCACVAKVADERNFLAGMCQSFDNTCYRLYSSNVNGIKKTNQTAILGILRDAANPLNSERIRVELSQLGYELSPRTIRLYLQEMGNTGLISNVGRGHSINSLGIEELHSTSAVKRVGFMSARIDRMTYLMDFDLVNRSGSVAINVTVAPPEVLATRIDNMCKVFERGYAMGRLAALFGPGETVGLQTIPPGFVGIATVCSVTLNGILLKHGIPTNSRFGGLLEIVEGKPIRFVEIITYEGTSIDPLEVFISSGMTDYLGAIQTGNGRIGASFREFPAESRDRVEDLASKLERVGLGGFMLIGRAGQPLLDIPVSEGRFGAILIGGLNPVAVLEETGFRARSRALAGLVTYDRLFRYEELPERLSSYQNPLLSKII